MTHRGSIRRCLLVLAALALSPAACSRGLVRPSEATPVYETGRWVSEAVSFGGRSYPVGVWMPDGWRGPGPALVFLHGLGECGSDGQKQLTVGLPPAIEAEPSRWPFVVICPQKPDGASQWEDHAGAVFAAIDRAVGEGLVDPRRVAITGLSQGGHGTISIAAMEPGRFRAAAPVCGYIARPSGQGLGRRWSSRDDPAVQSTADALASMPVWLFHGGKDGVVPPTESHTLHELLGERGGNVQLTVFPDDDHNSWDSAYRGTGLNEWLVERTR